MMKMSDYQVFPLERSGTIMKHDISLVKQALSQLSSLEKDCIDLQFVISETNITDSKIGGFPYVPTSQSLSFPVDGNNTPLRMICQVNLEGIAKISPIFPLKTGILQFWISDQEESHGTSQEAPFLQEDFRVIYHKTVETAYTAEDILLEYPKFIELDPEEEMPFHFPVNCPEGFLITAAKGKSPLSLSDFSFDQAFSKAFNLLCPEHPVESYEDLDIPNSQLGLFLSHSKLGHRLLGYPDFSQEDPRPVHNGTNLILLLQLDSEMVEEATGKELIWGECGVANWFISPEDLEKGDFSKVLFTWDCD